MRKWLTERTAICQLFHREIFVVTHHETGSKRRRWLTFHRETWRLAIHFANIRRYPTPDIGSLRGYRAANAQIDNPDHGLCGRIGGQIVQFGNAAR